MDSPWLEVKEKEASSFYAPLAPQQSPEIMHSVPDIVEEDDHDIEMLPGSLEKVSLEEPTISSLKNSPSSSHTEIDELAEDIDILPDLGHPDEQAIEPTMSQPDVIVNQSESSSEPSEQENDPGT
jgi:hypothetical protein